MVSRILRGTLLMAHTDSDHVQVCVKQVHACNTEPWLNANGDDGLL